MRTRVGLAVGSLACKLLGCAASDDAADEGAATSSSETSTSATTTSPTNPTTLADESSTTGPPPGDGVLECVETCTVPLDCCLPGTVGCPGAYPYNVACVDGFCVPPPCMADDECPQTGDLCRDVGGVATCVTPCADDDACTPPSTCAGTSDDGIAFCFERCDAPGVFCGNETCDVATGLCVCTSSGDCPNNEECID
jgi:hypothetical protein